MNMSFYMPTKMITGKDCVKANADIFTTLGKKCLIVTGELSARKCGALKDVTHALDKNKIKWTLYEGIHQNPTIESCTEAAEQATRDGAEFVIGIGGGSPLDAAKAIAVLAANPGMSTETLYSLKWEKKPLPIAEVGTTAGTGSEVMPVAVITVPDGDKGRKQSIRSELIYPAVSFGDPTYTVFLPDDYTRSTAEDALAHCIESYFNRTANTASRSFAAQGIRMLIPVLKKIADHGTGSLTYDDRESLYNASIFGGMSINVTGTAFPHALGYFLSERHGVAHGTACAVFLPAFLRHCFIFDPESASHFEKDIQTPVDELISVILSAMPHYDIKVTDAEQDILAPRWINNRSILKTPGIVSPEYIRGLIKDLFG